MIPLSRSPGSAPVYFYNSEFYVMVNVLKVQTVAVCHKRLDKQCRPRQDMHLVSTHLRKQSEQGLLASILCIPALISEQKEKSVRNF